jgi:hypothetical protein
MKVTNHSIYNITLEDGTVVAANGTDGSTKDVTLSESDMKRYVRPGLLVILDHASAEGTGNQAPLTPPAPLGGSETSRKKESK